MYCFTNSGIFICALFCHTFHGISCRNCKFMWSLILLRLSVSLILFDTMKPPDTEIALQFTTLWNGRFESLTSHWSRTNWHSDGVLLTKRHVFTSYTSTSGKAIWVVPKCFCWIQWQKYLSLSGLQPATSCVRDQDATTAPARHMWETGSLNWTQFMLHWFIRFCEFTETTEFNKNSAAFRKISINQASWDSHNCSLSESIWSPSIGGRKLQM